MRVGDEFDTANLFSFMTCYCAKIGRCASKVNPGQFTIAEAGVSTNCSLLGTRSSRYQNPKIH